MEWKSILLAAAAVAGTIAAAPGAAYACGCFAQQTVGQPVVQAGERIVFAHQDGKIVAHIQIQYQGSATDFAWLLPMPAVPELKLGTEELFTRLEEATRPTFVLTQQPGDGCGLGGGGGGCTKRVFVSAAPKENSASVMTPPLVVKQASAGPYDYAVLDASTKQPVLDWLRDNSYFVPAGTENGIDPYVRPGAYFLALKLRAGETTGDLQPVVVEYASERPMIPIILTAVAANPNMGILVWVLGSARAIPHNYQHVLINEEFIDWPNAASNYADVVTRAVDEAQNQHAFVTEYAGPTDDLRPFSDPAHFGDRMQFERITTPSLFVDRLIDKNFWHLSLVPILSRAFSIPADAFENFVDPSQYFDVFVDYAATSTTPFDPQALTAEIWERVVEPTIAVYPLVEANPIMTRLFTTMSPEEMTEDPVFAFNRDLPMISNVHTATLITHCEGDEDRRVELVLEDQRSYRFADQNEITVRARPVPFAARIEILRQEGAPEIVIDNQALLAEGDDMEDGGCIGAGRSQSDGFGLISLVGLALVVRALWRRRR